MFCLRSPAALPVTLRVAGGWVRDKLMGRESDDIDIALDTMLGKDFAAKACMPHMPPLYPLCSASPLVHARPYGAARYTIAVTILASCRADACAPISAKHEMRRARKVVARTVLSGTETSTLRTHLGAP